MQVTLKFTPTPPPAGKTFSKLRVILTDAGGAERKVDLTQAQVQASAQPQPDGSYLLPVTIENVAVGPYTVISQAFDQNNSGYGTTASGTGTVSLADGVWYPAPVSFV
jgi:hypothetical protein